MVFVGIPASKRRDFNVVLSLHIAFPDPTVHKKMYEKNKIKKQTRILKIIEANLIKTIPTGSRVVILTSCN
jgi:hypothetical protein